MTADDLFARAKSSASIVDVAGVRLVGRSAKRRGPCPLCRHGEKSKSGFAFEVDVARNNWRCFACDEWGGSVIDLEHRLHGLAGETIVDAARRLAGDVPKRHETTHLIPAKIVVPDGPRFADRFAAEIWREAIPAGGTLVQRYLINRGLSGLPLITAVKLLRFHPRVYHSGPRSQPLAFPAQVGQVVVCEDGAAVPTGGIHVTYLARDGSGKAHVPEGEKAKKMWGPQGKDGSPGGLWLAAPFGDGPVLVAEGIETVLAMAVLHDGPSRPLAALSLGRLQGGYQLDAYGRFDPDVPRPDPERPGFTWPGVGDVIVGLDHDMSPIRVKVRKIGGGTVERILSATERARLCGTLATAAWQQAGATSVKTVAPPLGEDFNDMLRREQAA